MSQSIKTTRMTAYIRDNMIAKAMETSGINAAKKDLIELRASFAEIVRQRLLEKAGINDKEITEAVSNFRKMYPAESPVSDFLEISIETDKADGFNVNLNGMNLYFWLDGRRPGNRYHDGQDTTHLTEAFTEEQEGDAVRYLPRCRMDLASPELADRFIELEAKHKELAEKEVNLKATLTATIKRFGTVESMVKQWPESEELLPAELKPSTALALSVDDLNAICGIPQGE